MHYEPQQINSYFYESLQKAKGACRTKVGQAKQHGSTIGFEGKEMDITGEASCDSAFQ